MAIALAAQNAEDARGRGPASKPLIVHADAVPHRHTDKLRGPLFAEVSVVGALPAKAGDVFVLRALISSETALSNVGFKWSLPAGVELVRGDVNSVISRLMVDQPYETSVTLRQVADDNAQVHLLVRGRSGGARFAQSVQFNTLLQSVLPESLASSKGEKPDVEAGASKPRTKIFH